MYYYCFCRMEQLKHRTVGQIFYFNNYKTNLQLKTYQNEIKFTANDKILQENQDRIGCSKPSSKPRIQYKHKTGVYSTVRPCVEREALKPTGMEVTDFVGKCF